MNTPSKVIIHCADTPNGREQTVEDIDRWHGERTPPFIRSERARNKLNKNLAHIGYHYVIYVDGTVHQGRGEDEIGAQCQGENQISLGVCLIGKNRYTLEQWAALKVLVKTKGLPAHGHYEFASAKAQGKTCPNFDVQAWVVSGYVPDPAKVLAHG